MPFKQEDYEARKWKRPSRRTWVYMKREMPGLPPAASQPHLVQFQPQSGCSYVRDPEPEMPSQALPTILTHSNLERWYKVLLEATKLWSNLLHNNRPPKSDKIYACPGWNINSMKIYGPSILEKFLISLSYRACQDITSTVQDKFLNFAKLPPLMKEALGILKATVYHTWEQLNQAAL